MTIYQKCLLGVFLVLVVVTGINPASRTDWLLESFLVFAALVAVVLLSKRIHFSNTAYTLLAVYLSLQMITAYYGVAQVPIGDSLGEFFGSTRNIYDRITHFAFGLLCFLPITELLEKIYKRKHAWLVSIMVIFALSAIYEILEWFAASFISPAAGLTFIGAQGDLWDPSKDMALAALGSLIALPIYFFWKDRAAEK